ncbi:helix-turn-helix transcriptional regulator (plasmid) [Novosphingobium resinovorum]|uniref:helix-turn-helix transcriptional regulator n=1 Tax=Sphingomonadaceae TaxID=41297 RepID=UPI00027C9F01|nr:MULTISPECIES: helix-turn-helix transcriptional regulator [Sphingomonadaceae]EJU14708.1 MerR family transcriptional regulator [Sphingomonas sp. LH128]WJM29767.1 helix-turn-helix transcriptional regulator [Novosphingobium resinovorum]
MPKETDAARLLREMQDRDALIKSLDSAVHQANLAPFMPDINAAIEKLKQPLFQDTIRRIQQGPAQSAVEIARGLTQAIATGSLEPAHDRPKVAAKTQGSTTGIRTAADLGALIRKARKAMKLNQAEFAQHAGVGRRFVSELESGKGTLEIDKVIACALAAGIDISARSRSS